MGKKKENYITSVDIDPCVSHNLLFTLTSPQPLTGLEAARIGAVLGIIIGMFLVLCKIFPVLAAIIGGLFSALVIIIFLGI